MNNGSSIWESLHVHSTASQPSPNPWAQPASSNSPFTTIPIIPVTLSPPSAPRPRGNSTSIALGNSGIPSVLSNDSIGTSTSSLSAGEGMGSSLRPRAGLRRLRSDLAKPEDTPDDDVDLTPASKPSRSQISRSVEGRRTPNGISSGDTILPDSTFEAAKAKIASSSTLSLSESSSLSNRRAVSREPPVQEPSWDWDDDNDKTRESKARKGKRQANQSTGPFGFGLSSVGRLWEDMENLLNSTLAPGEVYTNERRGHAYLDVWGRPIKAPDNDEPRGRERSSERGRGITGRTNTPGPLIETDVSTSTTPGLLRKTTDSIRDNGVKNLVSSKGMDVVDLAREGEAETEVFEHVVLPTDSLAGVALKYGITVAQLRKCNKMWASDTIHLRKVLYVPVSAARPAGGELIDLSETSTMSSRSSRTNDPSKSSSNTTRQSPSKTASNLATSSRHALSDTTTSPKSITSTPSTKRVLLSELSYFPPATVPSTTIFTSNPHPSTISSSQIRKWELENGTSSTLFGTIGSSTNARLSTSPRNHTNSRATSPSRLPASIFNVFPSLNDLNITTRASFESARSPGGSLPGSGNASGEEEVELDELVKRSGKREGHSDLRKRVKLKPRVVTSEDSRRNADASGRIITEQLGPQRMMELPVVSPPGSGLGSYATGWRDPDQ